MKKLIYFLFLPLILGCSTKKKLPERDYSKAIIYVLPASVQNIFVEGEKNENTYFVLEKINDLKFRIYREKFEVKNNWIKSTNRYIFLEGKLYPLLFEYDNYFAITQNAQKYLEDYKNGIFEYTKKTTVRDHVYHVDFNIKGEVFYTGY